MRYEVNADGTVVGRFGFGLAGDNSGILSHREATRLVARADRYRQVGFLEFKQLASLVRPAACPNQQVKTAGNY
jgi:hypothetical protein